MPNTVMSLVTDKRFSQAWFINYAMIIVGAAITASGYVFFIVPHKIVPGGVYGLSVIIHHLFDLPTGLTALVLNIPLIIWGIKELGPRFGVKTILGLTLTSVILDGMTYFYGSEPLTEDMLMSALLGGACIGVGLGLIFKAKATTGGGGIVAKILNKRLGAPEGRIIIVIDGLVVIAGIIAFRDPTLVLYAVVTIFVTGRTIDGVLEGMRLQKAVMIISQQPQEIRKTIITVVGRGGTIFSATGLFSGADKPVILTALSRRELVILEDHIKQIDPQAFLMVFDVREILGRGFQPLIQKDT
ncbi:MAG: YitT family protein [Proteobacteria bacterium]|nr:YitT family protein [Pseudomonadota bacterium]